jgi:hypothetical protein
MVWDAVWGFAVNWNFAAKADRLDRLNKEAGAFMYSFAAFSAPWRFIGGGGSITGIYNEPALWLWELRFGGQAEAKDRKGRVMAKGAYRQEGSDYAWDIYYNAPRKPGRPCRLRDFEIAHVKTCAEKARAGDSN